MDKRKMIALDILRGGGNNWTPAIPLETLLPMQWIEVGTQTYSDDAGTTPATADGVIALVKDLSGNNNYFSQTNNSLRLTYKATGFNGYPSALGNGSSQYMVSPSMLDASYNTAFTIVTVVSAPTTMARVYNSSGITKFLGQWTSAKRIKIQTSSITDNFIYRLPPVTKGISSSLAIIGYSYDGVTRKLTINGATASKVTTGNLGLSGAMNILATTVPNNYYDGHIAAQIVYKGALSDAAMLTIQKYFAGKYGLSATIGARAYVFDGDSITEGVGCTAGNDYPNQTMTLMGVTRWDNAGVADQTLTNLNTNAPDLIVPLPTGSVVVVFAGTNDIAGGADGATTYSRLETYCGLAKAAGHKVVVVTMLPRTGTDAARADYNGLIRTNAATLCDAVADVGADATIGENGDNSNLSYYADGLHPNNAGAAIVAGYVRDAIATL